MTAGANRNSRLRIVVLGYVIRGPLGGMVWSNLQYLTGLAALGHEVWFVEDSDDYPSCYDPSRHTVDENPAYGLDFAGRVFARLGFAERWAYYDAHRGAWHGPAASTIRTVLAGADLLLDLCGVNPLRPWLLDIPKRVLVDEDPAFTQIRHLSEPAARERALLHNAFFTFGVNFGRPGCAIPDDGLPWRPTRQPLVLDAITPTPGPRQGAFTTVMQWESYPAREWGGRQFGMKSTSFIDYLELAGQVTVPLELAVGGATTPRELLRAKGWRVADALAPTRDPWSYQAYLAASRGEFSVAKHGYVVSHSGWFSERSVAYLASGRPVVLQETGFSAWLPTGAGLCSFTSPAEAAAALAAIDGDYPRHCRAARELAEAHFAAGPVLSALLDDIYAAAVCAAVPAGPA